MVNTAEKLQLSDLPNNILEFEAKSVGVFRLTKTMLNKSIIDANNSIRQLARLFDVDYELMQPNEKIQVPYQSQEIASTVTFYKTARGDRRISIQKIKEIAGEGDTLSMLWAKNELGELILILK